MTLAAMLAAAMLPRPRQAARRACRLPVAHSAAASTIQRKPWSARRDRPGRTYSEGQEPLAATCRAAAWSSAAIRRLRLPLNSKMP